MNSWAEPLLHDRSLWQPSISRLLGVPVFRATPPVPALLDNPLLNDVIFVDLWTTMASLKPQKISTGGPHGRIEGSTHRVKETYVWSPSCFYGTEFEPAVPIH